jgi:hypothetical protein
MTISAPAHEEKETLDADHEGPAHLAASLMIFRGLCTVLHLLLMLAQRR